MAKAMFGQPPFQMAKDRAKPKPKPKPKPQDKRPTSTTTTTNPVNGMTQQQINEMKSLEDTSL